MVLLVLHRHNNSLAGGLMCLFVDSLALAPSLQRCIYTINLPRLYMSVLLHIVMHHMVYTPSQHDGVGYETCN